MRAREPRPLEDLGDVAVPAHLVAFLLAGRQVRAHEAQARRRRRRAATLQGQADRDGPLSHIHNHFSNNSFE